MEKHIKLSDPNRVEMRKQRKHTGAAGSLERPRFTIRIRDTASGFTVTVYDRHFKGRVVCRCGWKADVSFATEDGLQFRIEGPYHGLDDYTIHQLTTVPAIVDVFREQILNE